MSILVAYGMEQRMEMQNNYSSYIYYWKHELFLFCYNQFLQQFTRALLTMLCAIATAVLSIGVGSNTSRPDKIDALTAQW